MLLNWPLGVKQPSTSVLRADIEVDASNQVSWDMTASIQPLPQATSCRLSPFTSCVTICVLMGLAVWWRIAG
jgi:hypothetical protein